MLLQHLRHFLHYFKPELYITHVSLNDSPGDSELFNAFSRIAEDELDYEGNITFHRITDNDPCDAMVKYLDKINAQVLVLCMEKHDFIYRLFHENLIKKMTAYDSGYPILIVHK